MQKMLLLLIISLFPSKIFSQDLINKVPKDVAFYLSLHQESIVEKLPLSKFEKYDFYLENILHKMDKSKDSHLEDWGINFNTSVYFFYEITDSGNYFCTLIPLNNADKFVLLHQNLEIKKMEHGIFKTEDGNFYWNDKFALHITGGNPSSDKKDEAKERRAKRFFLHTEEENSTHNKDLMKSIDKNADIQCWINVKYLTMLYFETLSDTLLDENTPDESKLIELKNALSYDSSLVNLIKSTSINGYFEDDKFRITSQSIVNDYFTESLKKIHEIKINTDFFKYISKDSLTAYYNVSFNTHMFLEELPLMLDELKFLNDLSSFRENRYVVSDIFNLMMLLIDEEEIGNLFTGNAMLTLMGTSNKEVTYETYEYDEDFNYEKVQKTQNATIPHILLQIETNDAKNMTNLIKLLNFNDGFEEKEGYYQVNSEIQLGGYIYFIIKNDILFLCNTEEQLTMIVNDKTPKTPISKQDIKTLSSNSESLYIDVNRLLKSIDHFAKISTSHIIGNINEKISYSSSKIKGNKIRSELVITTPKTHNNSLAYVFDLINKVYLYNKNRYEKEY